jgi:hypothetical protein
MAFFSDGSNEYFSLNLDPAQNERSFVYPLTKIQISVSRYSIPHLLLMSMVVFIAIMFISSMEYFGLSRAYIDDSDQELLVIFLAGITTIIAFTEIFFFFWIKKNKLPYLYEIRSKKLAGFSILNNKSWMTYLIFLLDMLIPFLSLLALPGGLSKLFNDISNYGLAFRMLLVQLFVILLIFLVFLLRRLVILLFKLNVS